jgi:hypothetical protein
MPDAMRYDPASSDLRVGDGRLGPVSVDAWEYDVNGMMIIRKWFGYRRKNPTGRRTSPLDEINLTAWTDDLTDELLTLVGSIERLGMLEPAQEALLDEIVATEQITVANLENAGVFPVGDEARRPVAEFMIGVEPNE